MSSKPIPERANGDFSNRSSTLASSAWALYDPGMEQVFEQHRPRLRALAHRLLGSHAEAEDVVQEVWLRWQSARHGEIQNATGWLVRVCTNLCLDVLQSARWRREEYPGERLPSPWVASCPVESEWERRDGLSQAYLWMLEQLSPLERVTLVLHEVFEWSHQEIGLALGRSTINCRQILFRARQKRLEPSGAQGRLDPNGASCDRRATEAFVAALGSGDVSRLLGVLAPEVVLRSDGGGKATAALRPVYGAAKVARFFTGILRKAPATVQVVFTGSEYWVLFRTGGRLVTAMTLVGGDAGVDGIFLHRNPDKLSQFAALSPL